VKSLDPESVLGGGSLVLGGGSTTVEARSTMVEVRSTTAEARSTTAEVRSTTYRRDFKHLQPHADGKAGRRAKLVCAPATLAAV
jgi:hypothetical protein